MLKTVCFNAFLFLLRLVSSMSWFALHLTGISLQTYRIQKQERPALEVFQDGTKKKCMVLRYDWISLIKKSCNICLSGNESM